MPVAEADLRELDVHRNTRRVVHIVVAFQPYSQLAIFITSKGVHIA